MSAESPAPGEQTARLRYWFATVGLPYRSPADLVRSYADNSGTDQAKEAMALIAAALDEVAPYTDPRQVPKP